MIFKSDSNGKCFSASNSGAACRTGQHLIGSGVGSDRHSPKILLQKVSHVSGKSGRDFIHFRLTPALAAVLLSFSVSGGAFAENLVYPDPDSSLKDHPFQDRHQSIYPDEVSGNTVTNLEKAPEDIMGGVSKDSTVVSENTVNVKADVGLSVFGGVSIDGDFRPDESGCFCRLSVDAPERV